MKFAELGRVLDADLHISPEQRLPGKQIVPYDQADELLDGQLDYYDRDSGGLRNTFYALDQQGPAKTLLGLTQHRAPVAVLDFGAGTGHQAQSLLEGTLFDKAINLDRVVVDAVSDRKCDHLSQNWRTRVAEPVGLINYEARGSLTDFDFPTTTYDLICAYDAFAKGPAAESETALFGLVRALKPGGIFYFNTVAEQSQVLENAGVLGKLLGTEMLRYDHRYKLSPWPEELSNPISFKLTKLPL